GFRVDLICLSSGTWPSKGTVRTITSAAEAAAILSAPEIFAWRTRVLILSADCCARAERRASPKPSLPVPPRMAMVMGNIVARDMRLYMLRWGVIFPLVSEEHLAFVRSLRLRYAQRRDDMLFGRLGEFWFEGLLGGQGGDWGFDFDARVGGIALGGDASGFQDH